LQAWIKDKVVSNHQIVLTIDANEDITGKQGKFRPYAQAPNKGQGPQWVHSYNKEYIWIMQSISQTTHYVPLR